ncbi:MAG: hypothetical protein OXI88_19825 [Gammaproteobacteria bacterium]|nr:hypothetical protein [Gammaproteobacteria bacterium]MDE0514020.1 hypothetical protein [Gammaproteobacteria bacterium]
MSIQFDLFLHSAEVVAENELRESLLERNASQAQQKFEELRTRNPDHKTLAPASAMIDALHAEPPQDSNTALGYLNRLDQEWIPAAKTLFGVEGREILAPVWRATGLALESIHFDPEHPDHHASRAYLACGDWNAALRVTEAEQDYENQPVLLERMAQAFWQLHRTAQAFEQWFLLCWLAPAYFEELIENGHITASLLLEHRTTFINTDMEPELTTEWYPAWVLLHEPGLARSVTGRDAIAGPERAFNLVKELLSSNDEQLAARKELRDIHPGLFHYYLHNQAPLLQV